MGIITSFRMNVACPAFSRWLSDWEKAATNKTSAATSPGFFTLWPLSRSRFAPAQYAEQLAPPVPVTARSYLLAPHRVPARVVILIVGDPAHRVLSTPLIRLRSPRLVLLPLVRQHGVALAP